MIDIETFRRAAKAYLNGELNTREFGLTISDYAMDAAGSDSTMFDLAAALINRRKTHP